MELTPNETYHLLYKFLKEEGILVQYLYNCVVVRHKKKSNAKEMLQKQVNEYYSKYSNMWQPKFIGAFSCSKTTFEWERSPEKFDFWIEISQKWIKYAKKQQKWIKYAKKQHESK